jgi:hypothetical protein
VSGQLSTTTTASATSTTGTSTTQVVGADRVAVQGYDIEIGDDATLKATNSSVSAATATSTAAEAVAQVGNTAAHLSNSAVDNSVVRSGGDLSVTATTNSDGDATATSVSDDATAQTYADAVGIANSAFEGEADATLTATAVNTATIKASSVGDSAVADDAVATGVLSAVGQDVDDLVNNQGLDISGDATLTGTAGLQTEINASITLGDASATGELTGFGIQIDHADIGGIASFKGIGLIDVSSVTADVGNNGLATATSDLSVLGLDVADFLRVGDDATLESQASAKLTTSAINVGGDAIALLNDGLLPGAYDISGMNLGTLDFQGDGTFKSVLVDDFKTNATTVQGDARAAASHSLLGIGFNGTDSSVAGDVKVTSVLSHTSFTNAQSVHGIATASEHLSAIGVDVHDLAVDGSASFSSNVVVRATSSSDS